MLVDPGRGEAVRLLLATGLAAAVLPEIVPADDLGRERLDLTLAMLERLGHPGFPLALAVLLGEMADARGRPASLPPLAAFQPPDRRVVWLLEHRADLAAAPDEALVGAATAARVEGDRRPLGPARRRPRRPPPTRWPIADRCSRTAGLLDPPPLLTGDDLLAHGMPAGPKFRIILQRIRDGPARWPASHPGRGAGAGGSITGRPRLRVDWSWWQEDKHLGNVMRKISHAKRKGAKPQRMKGCWETIMDKKAKKRIDTLESAAPDTPPAIGPGRRSKWTIRRS